jgi:hypothetical protein
MLLFLFDRVCGTFARLVLFSIFAILSVRFPLQKFICLFTLSLMNEFTNHSGFSFALTKPVRYAFIRFHTCLHTPSTYVYYDRVQSSHTGNACSAIHCTFFAVVHDAQVRKNIIFFVCIR